MITISYQKDIIRTMLKSTYDVQKLRVSVGNRVSATFVNKISKQRPDILESDDEATNAKVLSFLLDDYEKVCELSDNKLTPKRFRPFGLIKTHAELSVVKMYVDIYKNEEDQFNNLKTMIADYPLYVDYLSKVDGLGPQMAAVIISEIDWSKCTYPSSLWKYAGLDVVNAAYYVDDSGTKHTVPSYELDLLFEANDYNRAGPIYKNNKYPIFFEQVGRSKKKDSLVLRSYTDRYGEEATRVAITFNPFLKTKLVGVLGTSFLRTGTKVMVNGERLGTDHRRKMAKDLGYEGDNSSESVVSFLKSKGHTVEIVRSKYAQVYIDYRNRLDRDERHTGKTPIHKHNMSVRYAVKRFLADLYVAGRQSEGLPVALEYAEAKLGLVHGQVSSGKLQYE